MMEAPAASRSLPIRIDRLSKHYGTVRALDAVDLAIEAGEFVTLLGPSGSGKTTLLMALAGFVRPDAGRIRFGEAEVGLLPPHRRNVGMVFQNYALFRHMTVLENVTYPLRLRGLRGPRARERAGRTLEMMRLSGFESRRVDQLSGGQQQRVALARAIVFEPPILLMDEPLSALDKKLREAMQTEIRRIHERVGATTVYVTHDQREALALSDRVAVVSEGRIQQFDRPERLYAAPANLFVADFLGDAYFLPVETVDGRCAFAGRPLSVPGAPPAGRAVLVLRPEKLEILPDGAAHPGNLLEGTVLSRLFLGDSLVLGVALAEGVEISVKVLSQHRRIGEIPESGARLRLGLHPEDTILIAAEDAVP